MKFSIIIPTYNHCNDLLIPCIESIIKYSNLEDIELIVSANGCTDDTRLYLMDLKKRFVDAGISDHLLIVWSDLPIGYSKANNVGIKLATTDKIVLLNNDVVILEQPQNLWLEILSAPFLTDPLCGISGPSKIFSECAARDFLIFFCVMIDRKVFETIGLLNEEYGEGSGEDIEFCILAEDAGFHLNACCYKEWSNECNLFVGTLPIYHKGEGTVHDINLVPDWNDIFIRNSLILGKKFNSEWYQKQIANNIVTDIDNSKPASEALGWLNENYADMYKEVITENIYQINRDNISNRNVLDIGANIGAFSLLSAYYGAKKVLSLEPVSATFEKLERNICQSGLKNIVTKKNAVTDYSGNYIDISINPDSGHDSLYTTKSGVFESVETVSLADLMNEFEGDNILMKIDCEGAEYDIILNARKEDMNRVNNIALEIHLDTHPIYKGVEIIENKLIDFGFIKISDHQIYSWNVTEEGVAIDYKEIPFKLQTWGRP